MRFLLDVYLGIDPQTICQLVAGIDPDFHIAIFIYRQVAQQGMNFGPDIHNVALMEDRTTLRISSLAQPSGYTEPPLHAWRRKAKVAAKTTTV